MAARGLRSRQSRGQVYQVYQDWDLPTDEDNKPLYSWSSNKQGPDAYGLKNK